MRGITGLGVGVLSMLACRQTVVIDQSAIDGGGGGGVDSGDGGPSFCSGPPTEFFEPPEVIVALDRSTGMGSALGVARDALELYAMRYQKVVRFGYVDFPGAGGLCTPMCGACPGEITPPPQTPNLDGFLNALHSCDQGIYCPESGLRPTNAALQSCAYVFSRRDPYRRYILLITNGRPDCAMGQSSGCSDAQTTISQLAMNAVTTHVIAPGQIDPNTTGPCLQGLAISSGTYHPAPTLAELTDVLGSLTRSIAEDACDLDPAVRIDNPDLVGVFWQGSPIPQKRNGSDGWELLNNGNIRLYGMYCDWLITNGPGDLVVYPTCNPPPPPH